MKPAGLVAKWWAFGAVGTLAIGCLLFLAGHPWLAAWAACGAAFGFYLSAVMR